MFKRFSIIALTFVAFALTGCATRYNRLPKIKMIEMGFFSCPKCGSLSGGVFGKGPTRHYRSDSAWRCVHDWQHVTMNEFQKMATDRFGVDWSGEAFFWSLQSE